MSSKEANKQMQMERKGEMQQQRACVEYNGHGKYKNYEPKVFSSEDCCRWHDV